jgi:hypothetical protein
MSNSFTCERKPKTPKIITLPEDPEVLPEPIVYRKPDKILIKDEKPEDHLYPCDIRLPHLTDLTRESSCNFSHVANHMRCLYENEFRPSYMYNSVCRCRACETSITDAYISKVSSFLNKDLIWNDIIKRWEPTIFNQDISESIDQIDEYEFRTYKNIYQVHIERDLRSCGSCVPAKNESKMGIGYVKAMFNIDMTDRPDNCGICNILDPYSKFQLNLSSDPLYPNWVPTERRPQGPIISCSQGPQMLVIPRPYGDTYEYRMVLELSNNLLNEIIPCGEHLWKCTHGYFINSDGTIISNIPVEGYVDGMVKINFVDILDTTQTFSCKYTWTYSSFE